MVKNLVVIIHGLTGGGDQIWHPWLAEKLKDENTTVLSPTFPDSCHPDFDSWNKMFLDILSSYNYDNLYLCGHSLGGFFSLKNMSDYLHKNEKLRGVVLVAPVTFYDKDRFHDLPFLSYDIDWDVLRTVKVPIKLLYSIDDPSVNHKHKDLLLKELSNFCNFEYIEFNHYKHFTNKQIDEILIAMKEIIQ